MKIATFNVNGVNGRLPVLQRWLDEAKPDVVCLQELKAPQEKFPVTAIRDAGYGAIWHGQKSWNGVAILVRGTDPVESRRGLPGDPEDVQSRYIETEVGGILVGCLYLPNGNPAPGPKFDYKLRWFERLTKHAADLLTRGDQVVLAGDFNVMPTDLDVYKPERWLDDALFRPEVRAAYRDLFRRVGRMPSESSIPTSGYTPSGIISEMPTAATPGCALTICYSARPARSAWCMQTWIEMCAAGRKRATTRRHGSSSRTSRSGPGLVGAWPQRGGSEDGERRLLCAFATT